MNRDIVVTWPKTRPLASYLAELERATDEGLEINFRVPHTPRWEFGALRERRARCYMVHDGYVRGYNEIRFVTYRGPNEVARVESDSFAGFWPEGWYIVRDPQWRPIDPIEMRGFQGWRWFGSGDGS